MDEKTIVKLLNDISEESKKINKSVIEDDVKELRESIAETIKRVESANS